MIETELLSCLSKREFKGFGTQRKSGFTCTSIEPVHFQSPTMMRLRMVPPT